MQKNGQSIAPSFTPVASPSIVAHEPQSTLPVGPTGVVHRGAGPVPWHKRLALTKAPSPAAHHVLLVLGSFVSDAASDAWPSKATLASMTGRSPRVVQRALRELKSARLISVRQSSGRTPHYRLSAAPPETPASLQGRRPRLCRGDARVLGGETPASPEVRTSEVIKKRKAAAASTSDRTEVQQDEQHNPQPDTPARHTCPTCQKSWPTSYGTTCHDCPQPTASQLRRQKQKADNLESEKPWTPEELAGFKSEQDPHPTPETRADGCSPSPPTVPATADEAQKHVETMREIVHRLSAQHARGGGWTKLTDATSP